jgi:hypothetical protein
MRMAVRVRNQLAMMDNEVVYVVSSPSCPALFCHRQADAFETGSGH